MKNEARTGKIGEMKARQRRLYAAFEKQNPSDDYAGANGGEVSGRFKLIREKNKLTPGKMAKLMGLPDATGVYRIERGDIFPTFSSLKKLSETISIDINWLITGEKGPVSVRGVELDKVMGGRRIMVRDDEVSIEDTVTGHSVTVKIGKPKDNLAGVDGVQKL